ncbi:MAG TPA: Fic family protein [Acidimicrobiales bacterium]|nr:Fic family protein [Acidimicrobiales bacterium]
MSARRYESTHPWISFQATDVNRVPPNDWMLLGEAKSKCEHLAGAPLKPTVARDLYRVTLIKGALATTAIEGNTLTEAQANGILDGTYAAPPSRQYQEQEVRNVLEALQGLSDQIVRGERIELTAQLIKNFNRQVLKGLPLDDHVEPGVIRNESVAVGNYRGAPAEDCGYLLDRLVEWLNSSMFENDDPELRFAVIVAKAIYAHLYLAWIHPFGDGNGRTARLVEFAILADCGMVPMPAAHLLSNHYNLTRDQYYRELARASSSGGDTLPFLVYAITGFIDGIREAIDMVRHQQVQVAWVNFVHEQFSREPSTKATDRQRSLVLAMPMEGTILRNDLAGLTPKLAQLYASAGPRTLSRDLNHLTNMGLLRRRGSRGYEACSDVVLAFLPPMADSSGDTAALRETGMK